MAGRARAAAAGPVAAATGGRHPAPEGPPPRQVSAHRPRYPPRAPPPPPPHRGGASLSVGGRPGSSPQGSCDGRRHSLTLPRREAASTARTGSILPRPPTAFPPLLRPAARRGPPLLPPCRLQVLPDLPLHPSPSSTCLPLAASGRGWVGGKGLPHLWLLEQMAVIKQCD